LVPPQERISVILAYDLGLTTEEIVAFAAMSTCFDQTGINNACSPRRVLFPPASRSA
jgi:hypothetical protein